jgi:hypothetical protein
LVSDKSPSGDLEQSSAILINTGVKPVENDSVRPRFIVAVLPVRTKTDKTKLAGKLEPCLIPELQHHLAEKGYYAYRCNALALDANELATDKEVPAGLREPLGVAPDFVLAVEIDQGSDTIGFGVKALRMHVVLYDRQARKTVWEDTQSIAGWSLVDAIVDPNGTWAVTAKPERVHDAMVIAAKKLPAASGHRDLTK